MQRMALHLAGTLICLMATAAATAATSAPLPQGPALPPRKPGFMLYLSKPLGGGDSAGLRPKFGFRLEQVRMTGNNGAPDAPDPMQHRGLIGWQVEGGHREMRFSDMRLELGNHVTYDMSHGTLGLTSRTSSMTLGPRPGLSATAASSSVKAGAEPRSIESHFAAAQNGFAAHGGGFRESSSLLHEVAAAAVASFKSRINNQGPQRPFAASHPPQSMHDGGGRY